ncbi:SUMF1/EgtB/PvdO family nonheme iron enzyme [bacterium]|nr:SUMF1/EgtB/PvdO family nonheme iron enzyme [bacterium]
MLNSRIIILGLFLVPIILLPNSVPIITDVRIARTDSTAIIHFSSFDSDNDSLTYRLAFGDEEIDLAQKALAISNDSIKIPLDLLPDTDLPPHLFAYDGTGYGGEYLEVAPAKNARAFLSRFEITNLEFEAFVENGGYETEQYWIIDDGSISVPKLGWRYQGKFGWLHPAGWDNHSDPPYASDTVSSGPFHPVVGVSWWECWAYCKWAGVELPTEEQWRAAANKATTGSGILVVRGNFDGNRDGFAALAPTGSYPSLDFADLAGNVWEWLVIVRDVIDYAEFTCAARALAGGSWRSSANLFPDHRRSHCPLLRDPDIGLRTAVKTIPYGE